MSPRKRAGLRTLKAVSSSIRLNVLNLLFDQGPQSYTEIMKILRLNPSRDAGRFAYHLKYLLKTDLIEPDVETKEYRITDLGRAVISFKEEIEERFLKRKKMFVRTSRWAIEEFDRTRIVASLAKEAGVPVDLAQRIARETEKRLSEFKTKYLTAPLIREIVNTILIEKRLEEYRHKLTRLGLPVYDVTQLIKAMGDENYDAETIHEAAGNAVIEEYTLINVLPRDIADAHLSGALHINNLASWILKPNEFMHNLRFFFRNGLCLGRLNSAERQYPPPKSLESALILASNVLKIASTETSGEQVLDYFNIFLAPFTRGLSEETIREGLHLFILNLNQSLSKGGLPVTGSLGLEFLIPDFLENVEATGPTGKTVGYYGDFLKESRRVASLLFEVMFKANEKEPILNPHLIMKMRPEVLNDKECENLLLQSQRIAAESGLLYFANLRGRHQKHASYTATGFRLTNDWKGDWEIDTLQTGNIDSVIINLPRVSYEAGRKETRFFELLDEKLEMALRALEIKYRAMKKRMSENLLPFLTQKWNSEGYFRLANGSRLVSFVGLNETVNSFLGGALDETEKTLSFAEKIVSHLNYAIQKSAKKPDTRTSLGMVPNEEAARRLARLDVEKYGWADVRAQGTRQLPFYTDLVATSLQADISWKERMRIEERFHKLAPGSHLAIIQLADTPQDLTKVLSATKTILTTFAVGFYVFNRHISYCSSCKKTFYQILAKCPLCGSVNKLRCFSRVSAKHLPSVLWPPTKRSVMNRRVSYMLNSN